MADFPASPQAFSVGGGLMFARRQLQYLAHAGPVLIPAPPVVVPDLSQAFSDTPVRRRFFLYETQTPEFGRSDPPPPPAPDLSTLLPADPVRRRPLEVGLVHRALLLPPGFPPDWWPSADTPVRRRRFLTAEAFAAPVERPFVPFDPAANASTLPAPPLRPPALSARATLASIPPPAGPPSSALTPPGVVSWEPPPNQPVRPPLPRQPLDTSPQNLDPIPQPAPPEGSWYPSAEVPPLGLKARPWLEAFAQNVDPISTPAYLASFWLSYYPSGPFPKGGLLAALQQVSAEPPPIIEVTVILGAWRPEAPALFRTRPRLTPGEMVGPQDLTTLADAYGCMTLSQVAVTGPTLLDVTVTGPLLLQPTVTSPTVLDVEVC